MGGEGPRKGRRDLFIGGPQQRAEGEHEQRDQDQQRIAADGHRPEMFGPGFCGAEAGDAFAICQIGHGVLPQTAMMVMSVSTKEPPMTT